MAAWLMHFVERAPSTGWEHLPLSADTRCFVWVWYKPAASPQGLFVNIPEEFWQTGGGWLTMRAVVQAAGIDPRSVSAWSLYGAAHDGMQGINPAWDYPIPPAGPGVDSTIGIMLDPAMSGGVSPAAFAPAWASGAMPVAATPIAPAAGAPVAAGDVLSRMDIAWNAAVQLELQLAAASKQLNGTLLRINSLNRDLSFDENRNADQLDKRDWQEARRWLRDVAARVSRFLKDHHMGMTSTAGKRLAFEELYRQYVAPRREFAGIEQSERDFDSYRKTLQTLLNNMNAAQSSAVQDGERRAQLVLSRIAAKVRTSRSRK